MPARMGCALRPRLGDLIASLTVGGLDESFVAGAGVVGLRFLDQLVRPHMTHKDDLLMLRGRFSGIGLIANWIAADIVRLHDGKLVEHWDVIQDEATLASSKSWLPMFGASFPAPAQPYTSAIASA